MSIMGRTIPSDAMYPINALVAVKDVKKWLDKEKGGEEFSLERLHRILQTMVDETPFSPGRFDSRESPTIVSGDEKFRYRRPVWDLIAGEIEATNATEPVSSKVKAEWLSGQLGLCMQYGRYRAALETFRDEVTSLNLSFQEGPYEGFLDEDVVVLGSFKEKGENAIRVVREIVDELVPALTKHVTDISGK